jgi:hypothetical protein
LSRPAIAAEPQSQTTFCGTNVSLAVDASGIPPLVFQWRYNNTIITNATNSTLVLSNLDFTASGIYDAVVTNAFGSVTSAIAAVLVTDPDPAIGIRRSGTNVVISWKATCQAFMLEERSDFGAGASWVPAQGESSVQASEHTFAAPVNSSIRLYRLRKL